MAPQTLLIHAIIDHSSGTIDAEALAFEDTLVYLSRTKTVNLTNTSGVTLNYNWDIVGVDMDRPVTAQRSFIKTALPFNRDRPAFSITPQAGSIKSGETQTFEVEFSPSDMKEQRMQAVCRVPNLSPEALPIELTLTGRGLLPAVHFALPEPGSYVENKQPVTLSHENQTENVVEVKPIGIGIKVIFNIWVLNPTKNEHNWTLSYIPDTREEAGYCSHFRALTQRGTLEPGRKQLLQFEFLSDSPKLVISNWKFCMETTDIGLVLQGHAKDPNLLLHTTHLTFNNLIAGHCGKRNVTLINNDDIPLEIAVQDDSKAIRAAGWDMTITPSMAILEPGEHLELEVAVEAQRPGTLSRPIQIKCKHKQEPVELYIKAVAHAMMVEVLLEDQLGGMMALSPHTTNQIEFGTIELRETAIRTIHVVNLSEHFIEYTLEQQGKKKNKIPITIDQSNGIVAASERGTATMCFNPDKLGVLPNPVYNLKVIETKSSFR